MAEEKIAQAQKVEIKAIDPDTRGELSETLYAECAFCGKSVATKVREMHIHERLAQDFYCSFCLRHRFFSRNSNHVLIMTFRGIIGYYYYGFYHHQITNHAMYYSEILEYIKTHAATGLLNPVFSYDPDAYLWFIDFSRIGKGRGKEPYEEVLKTISDILICFNLPHHISSIKMCEVYKKWQEAIDKFYRNRCRPTNKKVLMPTLAGCGVYEQQGFQIDTTRNFVASDFRKID